MSLAPLALPILAPCPISRVLRLVCPVLIAIAEVARRCIEEETNTLAMTETEWQVKRERWGRCFCKDLLFMNLKPRSYSV